MSLYYEDHGTGHPILCIHGNGSSAMVWGDALAELARRGRVIAYDRRGCHRSVRPDPYNATTLGEQADDASALLDALGATPAVVIGRSYGGEIAVADRFYRMILGDETWRGLPDALRTVIIGNAPAILAELRG